MIPETPAMRIKHHYPTKAMQNDHLQQLQLQMPPALGADPVLLLCLHLFLTIPRRTQNMAIKGTMATKCPQCEI